MAIDPSDREVTALSSLQGSDYSFIDSDARVRERYGIRTRGAAYFFRTDLELIYDELARAIDSLEPNKQTLFLVKLASLNANELGDADLMKTHIQESLKDL